MKVPGRRRLLTFAVVGLILALVASAGVRIQKKRHRRSTVVLPTPPVEPTIEYARDIKPILEAHCCRCHGATKAKAGLRLDTITGIRKGSDSGGVLIPGNGAGSLLVAILGADEDRTRMPPTGEPLSADRVALIKKWIDNGAAAPLENERAAQATAERVLDHWAFKPPVVGHVPNSTDGHARNPIDAFVAARHTQQGLVRSPPAPRAVLVRRLFIDLIGLPPTRQELAAFLADDAHDAYERLVDRLLDSPRYGERWGRHWMDLWRYSDPDGRKSKGDIWWSSPHIWRWRDWIIRALNEDKGYDRMLQEMLAGDELAPHDARTLAATGFLARNWFKLDRNIWLSNTVEHTGRAFLGLTIGCARCHDHKFDPISQQEYYEFRAFFESHDIRADPAPGEKGPSAFVARAYDAKPHEPTWLFVRGDVRAPDKSVHIVPRLPAALGTMGPIEAPAANATSTGRRLALARWISDRNNPLTARVAVNHIWARHMGRPLVETVADFGRRTPAPAHQPLLDWLAVEFMQHRWSMKHMHRLMVTSATYQMTSSVRDASVANLAADPDNESYWRANPRRMEAEVVRDSILWLGGALDATAGGPPVDHSRGETTARRSLYYRYSREDKLPLLTAFDAPPVEECYRREQSVVPQQALALGNSRFVWDQARRIAQHLGAMADTRRDFVAAAFEHVLGRPPQAAEREACETFLASQERLLANPARLTPLPAAPLPLLEDAEVAKGGLPLVLGESRNLPNVAPTNDPAGRAQEYLIHALLNHNDFITVR